MPKINIRVSISNKENNNIMTTQAIVEDEKIKYKEKDNTLTIMNLKDNTLIRENIELRMNYDFNIEKGTLFVKELNKGIDLSIKTNKIERKNNNILIEFEAEGNKFIYEIEEIV